jgi:hypothetical protein
MMRAAHFEDEHAEATIPRSCSLREMQELMSQFRVALIRQSDGTGSDTHTYLVCTCGFHVWHMETDVYFGAQNSMDQCARSWRRRQDTKAAGGKPTRQGIRRDSRTSGRPVYILPCPLHRHEASHPRPSGFGIRILAPLIGTKRKKDSEAEKDITKPNQPMLVGFPAVYVFDVSRTEGAELPDLEERVKGEVGEYRERLINFVIAQGIELEFKERIAPALGVS